MEPVDLGSNCSFWSQLICRNLRGNVVNKHCIHGFWLVVQLLFSHILEATVSIAAKCGHSWKFTGATCETPLAALARIFMT